VEYNNPFEYEADLNRAIEGIKTTFELIPSTVLTTNCIKAMEKLVDAKANLKDELEAIHTDKMAYLVEQWNEEYRQIPFLQFKRRAAFSENYHQWLGEKEIELSFKAKEKYAR